MNFSPSPHSHAYRTLSYSARLFHLLFFIRKLRILLSSDMSTMPSASGDLVLRKIYSICKLLLLDARSLSDQEVRNIEHNRRQLGMAQVLFSIWKFHASFSECRVFVAVCMWRVGVTICCWKSGKCLHSTLLLIFFSRYAYSTLFALAHLNLHSEIFKLHYCMCWLVVFVQCVFSFYFNLLVRAAFCNPIFHACCWACLCGDLRESFFVQYQFSSYSLLLFVFEV